LGGKGGEGGGVRRRGAGVRRRNAMAAFAFTLSAALVVVHLTGVVSSLELMPTGPPLEDAPRQHEHTTPRTRTGGVGGSGDEERGGPGAPGGGGGVVADGRTTGYDRGADATAAAARWERDMMSPAVATYGGGGGDEGASARISGMHRSVGGARSLTHLEATTTCVPGTAVTHTAGACVDCTTGNYASGRNALCRFPNVPFSCSSMLNPTVFLEKYGFMDQLAANCDFNKDAARLITGDVANCSFADIGISECTPSAAVDANDAVTFSLKCAIALGDQTFQNCTGLMDGTLAQCTWAGKQENCTSCPAGSVCESPKTIDPAPCPMGYACPDGYNRQVCTPGTYAQGGAVTCMNCPNGSTCPQEGWKVPVACNAKYFSGSGATSCEPCWAGHKCATPGTPWPEMCYNGYYAKELASSCSACAAGNSSYTGASDCYVCPEGTSCGTPATAFPSECAAGFYAQSGSITCTPCDYGQYQTEAKSGSCIECPAGTRCPVRAISNLRNFYCPDGTYSRFTLNTSAFSTLPYTHTDANRFPTVNAVGDSLCRPCPDGYTCPSPATAPVLCPAGTTRIGTNHTHCISCPAGAFCATPDIQPVKCPDGSFSGLGFAVCTECTPGYYCPNADVDLQLRCDAGTYSLRGAGNCTTCPAGSACPNLDGVGIEACGPGLFATAGQVQCTQCPPGHACPSVTDPAEMVLCQPGSFSPGRLPVCVNCNKGFFQSKIGATALLDCIACSLGYYSNFTAASNNATCVTCPADTYCPLLGNALPTLCPIGLRTFGRTAMTSITACTLPPPPPPPSSPPPIPPSPPPPPLPPSLAANVEEPIMTVRLDGTVAAFNRTAFSAGVAAAVCCNVSAADVVIVDIRSGSVVVDFYVKTPALYPVALGGGWNSSEIARVAAAVTAAIQNNTLAVGAPVLSTAVESSCPAGTFVSATLAGGARLCDVCGTGFFSSANNAPKCEPCPPGYAAGARGMASCDICGAGRVAPTPATDFCAPCVAGTVQPQVGLYKLNAVDT
jgi:hypothetical protein